MAGQTAAPSRITHVTDPGLDLSEFSPEEIERLRHLRETYPYIEYTDSPRQWQRLRFVKWLYSQGQLQK